MVYKSTLYRYDDTRIKFDSEYVIEERSSIYECKISLKVSNPYLDTGEHILDVINNSCGYKRLIIDNYVFNYCVFDNPKFLLGKENGWDNILKFKCEFYNKND